MKSMIEGLRRAAERPRLMGEMMARLGVAPEGQDDPAADLALAQAARRCAGCGHEGACRSWLAETERAEHAPSFCANAGVLESLARR
ncbi:DUF6455 family protein [Salinarimonas ramus]|uniref:DUF6455 domain-containing protein n=1 Tax=Salinarimonas ramus TaxID=690164 RepID=A0A917V3Q2_9HYPH|nr:DUF6455 family protein [Salinarimonas ramus]GGK35393.1 hypothetical protein GCM10011322_22790 [Salinarimonas ramus]